MQAISVLFFVAAAITAAPLFAADRVAAADSSSAKLSQPPLPPITQPVMFNTPEADRILETLQVFPPENPWNEDISQWPVHSNSRNIVAAIGAEKPLRYNPDMAFILVSPK